MTYLIDRSSVADRFYALTEKAQLAVDKEFNFRGPHGFIVDRDITLEMVEFGEKKMRHFLSNKRFSKSKVVEAIENQIFVLAKEFEKFENKEYDYYNGTSQASTKDGYAATYAINSLRALSTTLDLDEIPY